MLVWEVAHDAAAAIRALNQLWQLKLSPRQMIDIGMQIGSDVPYCLCRLRPSDWQRRGG